jgi:UDP-N-acetylglucosamine--N-acetylmuramyl-(pentapeptide) pyrophosphoryl-undecaprenol N-acetylglucosamine transferase
MMAEKNVNIVVFVAGGTGGHLYPGIAIARALPSSWKALFIVRKGDRGKELLQREGFLVTELPGQGWPRRLSIRMASFPFVVAAGFIKAWIVLGNVKPHVIVGMGGYLSFPVLLAGRLRRIPTMIHEQNVFPGLSNRMLGRWVRSVAVSFEASRKEFPAPKVWVSGLPVRPEIGSIPAADGRRRFKLAEDKLTFLIFGGSQGAHGLNETVAGAWALLSDRSGEFQVLHLTGERAFTEINERYSSLAVRAVVIPYCHDMAAALAAADLVICRAGASTIAELLVAQKPALLVPFPFASENHQFYNAEIMVKAGAAELIPDSDFTPANLAGRLRLYFNHPERLPQMRMRLAALAGGRLHTTAARKLADYITGMP